MYTRVDMTKTVVVCHSEAGAWNPPLYETSVCPPSGARYVVGRTMVRLDAFSFLHRMFCSPLRYTTSAVRD